MPNHSYKAPSEERTSIFDFTPTSDIMLSLRSVTRIALPRRGLCTAADTVTVSIAEARTKTAAAMKKIGWDDEDANLQAEIMTAAELCGELHNSVDATLQGLPAAFAHHLYSCVSRVQVITRAW